MKIEQLLKDYAKNASTFSTLANQHALEKKKARDDLLQKKRKEDLDLSLNTELEDLYRSKVAKDKLEDKIKLQEGYVPFDISAKVSRTANAIDRSLETYKLLVTSGETLNNKVINNTVKKIENISQDLDRDKLDQWNANIYQIQSELYDNLDDVTNLKDYTRITTSINNLDNAQNEMGYESFMDRLGIHSIPKWENASKKKPKKPKKPLEADESKGPEPTADLSNKQIKKMTSNELLARLKEHMSQEELDKRISDKGFDPSKGGLARNGAMKKILKEIRDNIVGSGKRKNKFKSTHDLLADNYDVNIDLYDVPHDEYQKVMDNVKMFKKNVTDKSVSWNPVWKHLIDLNEEQLEQLAESKKSFNDNKKLKFSKRRSMLYKYLKENNDSLGLIKDLKEKKVGYGNAEVKHKLVKYLLDNSKGSKKKPSKKKPASKAQSEYIKQLKKIQKKTGCSYGEAMKIRKQLIDMV